MKLILSSRDFRNDKSRQTIMDHLSKPIDRCRLLFIPNEKATAEAINSEKYYLRMQEFGFVRNNIRIFDYYNPDRFAGLEIDVLYISGNNTFATLKRIKDCGFDEEIIRYVKSGVIYIGGSAGAHIASKSVEHLSDFDSVPDGMTDFKGLGLFNGILVCHYTKDRRALYDKLIADGKYNVFALTDDDSVVVNIQDVKICYCGHDCARCITYLATQSSDDHLREQSRRFYRKEFGRDIPLEKFNCSGGKSDKVFEVCQDCPFRKCCREKGMESCSDCPEYPCESLSDYQAKYVNTCNQL